MRLPRMTTWHLMTAVGIVGLLQGAVVLYQRAVLYSDLAAFHALQESSIKPVIRDHGSELLDLRWQIADWQRKAEPYRPEQVKAQHLLDAKIAAGLPTTQQDRRDPWYWKMQADEAGWHVRKARSRIAQIESGPAYHRRMRVKYEWAAAHPWETVEVEAPPWETFSPTEEFRPDPAPP
jgi:hypothetical protein